MKRSEFYAAMAIVIIMCSMSTVFAVSYQPQIIQPTKPYQKCFQNDSTNDSTFYTALDTVNGKGVVTNIIMNQSGNSNVKCIIKITIDGVAYEIKGPANAGTNVIKTAGMYLYDGTARNNSALLIYNCILYFKSSLKIEVQQTSGSTAAIDVTINYVLE